MQTLLPSINAICDQLIELDRTERPFADVLEVIAALELYQQRLRRAAAETDWLATRRNVVAIGAVSYRGLRDLGLVSQAEAVAKDDAAASEQT